MAEAASALWWLSAALSWLVVVGCAVVVGRVVLVGWAVVVVVVVVVGWAVVACTTSGRYWQSCVAQSTAAGVARTAQAARVLHPISTVTARIATVVSRRTGMLSFLSSLAPPVALPS
jgi:hypothetical protein